MAWKTATAICLLSIIAGLLLGFHFSSDEPLTNPFVGAQDCYHVPQYGKFCGEQLHITSALVNGSRIRIVQADDILGYIYGSKPLDHLDESKYVIAEDAAKEEMEVALDEVGKHAKTVDAVRDILLERVGMATRVTLLRAGKEGQGMGGSVSVDEGFNVTEMMGHKAVFEENQRSLPNWHVED